MPIDNHHLNNMIHLCPSSHCGGLLENAASVRVCSFKSTELSFGYLPSTKLGRDWLQERRSWLEQNEFFDVDEGHISDFLLGETTDTQVAIWFGKAINEQIFLWFVVSFLLELKNQPQILLFDCGTGNRSCSMAEMRLNEFSAIKPRVCDPSDFKTARLLWKAVTSKSPSLLNNLAGTIEANGIASAFPFFLNRYPSLRTGLCFWEQKILEQLAIKPKFVYQVLADCLTSRSRNFPDMMNDMNLLKLLLGLTDRRLKVPLIQLMNESGKVTTSLAKLTAAGDAVLKEEIHLFDFNDVSKAIGGVVVCNENPWYFDGVLVKRD